MSSYSFLTASTQRWTAGETYTPGTAHTLAAIVRVGAIPAATNYPTVFAQFNATVARVVALQFNGDNAGSLACLVGATRVSPSTQMIPPTAGEWLLIGAAKASGTVAVSFFMFNYTTGAWTEFNSTGTVANRTSAAVSPSIGSNGAANYYTGKIAAVLGINRNLVQGEWRRLIHGKDYWRDLVLSTKPAASNTVINQQTFVDLTDRRAVAPCLNQKNYLYATGTAPTLDPDTPPGW